MRCQPSVFVRVCAVAALTVVMSFLSPAPVGQAQSAPPLTPWRGLIDHVSATYNGGVPNYGVEVTGRAISGDGRFVVMHSLSPDLVFDDYNWAQDIFLRDRQTGTMTRVSLAQDGSDPNGFSEGAAICTNGRHVVFVSNATNLVAGDTNDVMDVFVRDLDGARTVRVSVATDGTQSDGSSGWPAMSATGRFVAFVSQATTLVPGPAPYGPTQIYVHDRDADGNGTFDEPGGTVTTLDSVSSSGALADNYTQHPRISADGRFVMFESTATNLDPVGNPSGSNHIYLRDRQTGTTELVDRAMTGGPSSWGTDLRSADMSDDGRFITYTTFSHDIVPFDMNWNSQALQYDAQAQGLRTSIVSRLPDGSVGNGYSFDTAVSADGRYVAFRSTSTNLATPPQPTDTAAIFVRDMAEGTFTRVDVLSSGEGFDHQFPYAPSISADGTAVSFTSPAQNAVDGAYTFGSQHTFVATAFSVSATSASFPMEGGTGSIEVNTLPVSGWNAVSLDPWIMLMDGGGFGAGPRTVNYYVDSNSQGIMRHGRIRLGSTIVAIDQVGDGDTTPPVITPIVTGTLSASGWYTSNITVEWSITDPDSQIVSTSPGCTTSTFTSDFLYASPTCEATSHGGTASVSVPLRRDTTPPTITINSPLPTYYRTGTVGSPFFNCYEPYGYAGVASCVRADGGSGPLDATTPGWRPFTVTATDQAGNTTSKTVEYLIGTGECVAQVPTLKAWWRLNGTMSNSVEYLSAIQSYASGGWEDSVAGKGWMNLSGQNYLFVPDESRLLMPGDMTTALWVKPYGLSGQSGTLVTKPAQYRIARYPDGTLRWAFSHTTGYNWVNTGAVIPMQVWSHVAVTYDNGLVKSYLNGRLVHTQQLTGSMVLTGDPNASLTIGGRGDLLATLVGTFDDVQIYDSALSPTELDELARAGSGSLCVPNGATITVSAPSTIAYASVFRVTAVLRDEAGNPLPNRLVWLYSHVAPSGFAAGNLNFTNAAGETHADLPVSMLATLGPYAKAASAVFEGDTVYREVSAQTSSTLVAGTPIVSWTPPAPIVYGTALGAAQLNATAAIPGSFSYSPPAGTVLNAGTHMLSVTFTPNDTAHWGPATQTRVLVVNKAAPVVTVTGGTFTYDNQPHPGSGSATGVLGEPLTPVQLLYNGTSETAPVNAGAHTVRASFAGSDNYTSGQSAAVPLVINKAVPTVEITGNSLFYTGGPRQVTVTVRGVGGVELNPVTVFYDGNAALPVNAGTYAVLAQFAGNVNYEAASASGTLVINKTTPIMSLAAETVTYDGQPHGASAAAVGVNNEFLTPIVITYDGSSTVPVNAGVYAVEARYDGSANYTAVSRTTTLTIVKAVPYLQWFPGPASIVFGTPLGAAQFGATANVPGAFSYSPAAGTVLNAGTHTLTATFTPADQANFTTGSITATLSVTKATPTVTWANPAAVAYGTPLGAAQLNASANVPGTFAYTPAAGTVLNAGTHVLSVSFTPDDASNYNAVSTGAVLTVTPASVTLNWAAPAGIVYGTALGAPQLNATASVPGTFVYTPAAGTVLNAGTHTLTVNFTPTDAVNYSPASTTTTLTVTPAAVTINWPAPAGIVYGTALGAAQLNATAGVPGTFAYSPAAGAVLPAGAHTLSVTFTPSDGANYTGSSTTRPLTVSKAPLAIAANNTAKPFGAPVPPFSVTPVGFVNGDSMALLSGVLTFATPATSSSPVGTYPIVPQGLSSPNYAITFVNGTLTVVRADTAVAVVASPNPSGFNQPVTYTATVSVVAPGAGEPSGVVQFFDGGTLVGTEPLAAGSAALTTNGLAAGSHSISATYSGDAGFSPSSATSPLTVRTSSASSTTTLTSTRNPANVGQSVTFRATVSAPSGTISGTVQFYDGSVLLGSAVISSGVAQLTMTSLPAGGHAIVARYLGNASLPPSLSNVVAQTIGSQSRSSSVALSVSPSPAGLGSEVTITATVTGGQQKAPTGNVLFMVNGKVLDQVAATVTGSITSTAVLPTSTLPRGTHTIVVVYLADATFRASTRATTLTIN